MTFWRQLPVVLYAVAIFVLGSIPMPKPPGPTMSDKTAHFIVFALFAVLVLPVLRSSWFRVSSRRWAETLRAASCAAVSSVVGGLLELWQSLLPHRTAEWADWFADTAGAGLGAAVGLTWLIARPSTRTTRTKRHADIR